MRRLCFQLTPLAQLFPTFHKSQFIYYSCQFIQLKLSYFVFALCAEVRCTQHTYNFILGKYLRQHVLCILTRKRWSNPLFEHFNNFDQEMVCNAPTCWWKYTTDMPSDQETTMNFLQGVIEKYWGMVLAWSRGWESLL